MADKISKIIMGRKPVLEAINSGKEINFVTNSVKIPKELFDAIKKRGILIKKSDKRKLDFLTNNGNHQGIVAQLCSKSYSDINKILEISNQKNEPNFLLILDRIQDPQNLGAIIRTAECMGVHGVVICKHEAAALTESVAKASAGAIEHILVARETNLSRTIDFLKKRGVWILGTDSSGVDFTSIPKNIFSGSVALVIGSEGYGISRLIKEKCDFMLSISLRGKINSLNVSVACGIFLQRISEYRL
ncbi:MAG: 23S rRNA (guanosine(2251)-2'-O)-methyltransferase RlmB [Oscillospiraceae bacterium]|jgi:23S rRNA (guanosine2251-2'-O)-methyltransferase|nr:23S rRNA (guanosine(2251)-2'-O)-methyltransferase RlmB [Oscillospiraceae bacterium]